jgi:hypothetical protein
MKSNSFPDPFSVFRLLPGPQHPHCCSLPSLLKVTSFPDPTMYFCPWDATKASSLLLFSAFFVESNPFPRSYFCLLATTWASASSLLFSAFFVESNLFPRSYFCPWAETWDSASSLLFSALP